MCHGLPMSTPHPTHLRPPLAHVIASQAWQELPPSVRNGGRPSKEEALLAVAVVNRIRRAISQVCVLWGQGLGTTQYNHQLFTH